MTDFDLVKIVIKRVSKRDFDGSKSRNVVRTKDKMAMQ